jgi:hypothetical protein
MHLSADLRVSRLKKKVKAIEFFSGLPRIHFSPAKRKANKALRAPPAVWELSCFGEENRMK